MIVVALAVCVTPMSAAEMAINEKNASVDYDLGQAQGSNIFFHLNETNGNVGSFGLFTSYGEQLLLDNLSLAGFAPSEMQLLGSLVKLKDENVTLVLHDNPTGLIHAIMGGATEVTIDLAEGLEVVEESENEEDDEYPYQLIVSDDRSSGRIYSDQPFDVLVDENGTVIKSECRGLMIKFEPDPVAKPSWTEVVIEQAIRDGRVAAEIYLLMGEEEGSSDVISYRSELRIEVQLIVKNKFSFMAEGESGQGTLLLVRAQEMIVDMQRDRLQVMLNGKEMRLVEEPMELLYQDHDETGYAVIGDGEYQQMLIYLPASFSGLVTVEGVDRFADLRSPTGMAIILGAVALVVLAGIVVFRRR